MLRELGEKGPQWPHTPPPLHVCQSSGSLDPDLMPVEILVLALGFRFLPLVISWVLAVYTMLKEDSKGSIQVPFLSIKRIWTTIYFIRIATILSEKRELENSAYLVEVLLLTYFALPLIRPPQVRREKPAWQPLLSLLEDLTVRHSSGRSKLLFHPMPGPSSCVSHHKWTPQVSAPTGYIRL